MVKIDENDKLIKTTDEDFFKMPPPEQWNKEGGRGGKSVTKFKDLSVLRPIAIILIILMGIAIFFLWNELSTMTTEVKKLSAKVNSFDGVGMNTQLMKFDAKLNYLSDESAKLKAELVRLKTELEVIQIKLEKTDAGARKQLPAKKTPAGGTPKTR